ncbi:MAG: porin [Desulfobacteraceae bacterium]|nr:MAG: porin [Desulfobacteraceae bacterium]
MKKLIAVLLVLLFAAPAMAAEWSFFGSQRVATFYVAQDYGDFTQFPTGGEDDDWGLQWQFQGNSRVGARVKADKVSGYIELALTAANGGDGGDGGVNTRRAYGAWKFADNMTLKVGKDYSPVTDFISGQVFDSDAGLLGQGNFYGRRPAGLFLNIGALELALLNNPVSTGGLFATAPAGTSTANTDPDWNLPKFEAAYTLKMDSFYLKPFAGINYFTVDQGANAFLDDEIDILSYVVGLGGMFNIGAFRIGGQAAYGQNWANANWYPGRSSNLGGVSYAAATLDGDDDTNDAKSWSAMLVAGLKFSDSVNFEIGAGYRNDDSDVSGVDNAEAWEAYGQAVLTLAPGVFLVPEVGYIAFMDDPIADDDRGYLWYAGAKWQINF